VAGVVVNLYVGDLAQGRIYVVLDMLAKMDGDYVFS